MSELSPTRLPAAPVQEHAHFVFWTAAGLAQTGELGKARVLIREALVAGADRRSAARLLLGGAYLQLGRAALLAEDADRAMRGLQVGLRLGVPGGMALCLDLMRAEAERCTQRGESREAVQRWQDIATLLGADTPVWVYTRLSAAYANKTPRALAERRRRIIAGVMPTSMTCCRGSMNIWRRASIWRSAWTRVWGWRGPWVRPSGLIPGPSWI